MDIDPEAVKWLQVIVEHNCSVCEVDNIMGS